MYVITSKEQANEDVIIHVSETIGYQENGNVLVDNDTLAIAKNIVKRVYEVDTIPEEVCEAKYCYTEEKGFYKNENYVEPPKPVEVQLKEALEQITDLQLAMAEIYESGV